MTNFEFQSLCGQYLINPDIVLENNNIVELLLLHRDSKDDNAKNGYRNLIIRALETEF